MKIFILKDKLTNRPAGVPFFSYTRQSALRDVLLNFKDHKHTLNQFDLYEIGSFDDKNGQIIDMTVELVCNLVDAQGIIDEYLK